MYVCGPTVYDLPHQGHGRMALVFDVLRRYLLFRGLDVSYVSNVTDVDDNIIKRAAEQGRSETEVAVEFEARWWEAMDALGVAYETGDGVYLDIAQVPGYGLLARQSLDSLRAGARVETAEEKRSPLDFALWKKAKPEEPTWEAPWHAGRPGWHTECVVMSLDLLGDGFDLHGGGQDLAFPHHENERAQAVVDGRTFARHWVHNGWVEVEGTKMSKSLGNFTSLTDMLDRSDGRAYRLLVLRSHYRSPIEVTPQTVADAEKGLDRLDALARRFGLADLLAASGRGYVVEEADAGDADRAALASFSARMDDDLDTPGALAGVFDLVSAAHSMADSGDQEEGVRLARTAAVLLAALGVSLRRGSGEVDEEARRLVTQRDEARRAKDFARADSLRDQLVALGWTVEDTSSGTAIHR
jgi:cysteinyl-tRNA synthetase